MLYEGQFLVVYCVGDQLFMHRCHPTDFNRETLKSFVQQSLANPKRPSRLGLKPLLLQQINDYLRTVSIR